MLERMLAQVKGEWREWVAGGGPRRAFADLCGRVLSLVLLALVLFAIRDAVERKNANDDPSDRSQNSQSDCRPS